MLISDRGPNKLASVKKELTPQPKYLAPHVLVSALHGRQERFGRKRYSQIHKYN